MIVTACNGKPGMMRIIDGKPLLLNEVDTRGACYVQGVLWYLTHEGLHRHRPGDDTLVHTARRDWHGLHNAGDCLLAVDPVTDEIVEYTLSGKLKRVWAWKPESAGRLHTNDVCVDGGDIYVSTFNWGICKNGKALGFGKHVQPHSVTRHEGLTYYCGSNLGQVMREGDVLCEPGGFTRGFLAARDGFWVGSSQKRNGAGGTCACVQFYTWAGDLVTTIPLPTNEVYAIV